MNRIVPVIALTTLLVIAMGGCNQPAAVEDPPGAPARPASVTVEPGADAITILWTDNSDDEDGFAVYRAVDASGGESVPPEYAKIATTEPDVTQYVDVNVEVGVAYLYAVAAFNGNGETIPVEPESREPVQTRPFYTLTVRNEDGSGLGVVRSDPGGVHCGADCDESFERGTTVTLVADPDPSSHLAAWGGACSGSASTCTIEIMEDTSVTATFELNDTPPAEEHELVVANEGDGLGVVRSDPGGIFCGSDCDHAYPAGTEVTLTAEPDPSSHLARWDGDCSGSDATCTVAMTVDRHVVAIFELNDPPQEDHTLTVAKDGPGDGAITSEPTGIDCGNDCQHEYEEGTTVTLTAEPDSLSSFEGWGGDCSGSEPTCTLELTGDRSATATFRLLDPSPVTFALRVETDGPGEGRVVSEPSGIDCGSDCEAEFEDGQTVHLAAHPEGDSTFREWAGDCTGAQTECTLTMRDDRDVRATFDGRCGAGLVHVGDLEITVSNVDDHDLVTEVTGDLRVEDTDLGSLDGFPCLAEIGGELRIRDNEDLDVISGFAALTHVGRGILIRDNDDLERVTGFRTLAQVADGGLTIRDNEDDVEIDGFYELDSVKGGVTLDDVEIVCPSFQSLDEVMGRVLVNGSNAQLPIPCGDDGDDGGDDVTEDAAGARAVGVRVSGIAGISRL